MRVAAGACALACLLAGCGGGGSDRDRGAGVGALGSGARADTLARAELERPAAGELAWVAHELELAPGQEITHRHELAFAYGRRGASTLGGATLAEDTGSALTAGERHLHGAGDESAVVWEIRLARPGSSLPGATRPLFESEPLEGIPAPARASFLVVTVPPRGGQTTVHSHPGPEFIYELSGRIDYQNGLIGTKRLGPGGAEAIPPDTAVQKRNPYARPAVFLSWFVVDPDAPFAPKASF